MVKKAKDLRGKSLPDLFEKMLTAARYFIVQKNNGAEFSERTMYDFWNTCFPSDFRITKKTCRVSNGKSKKKIKKVTRMCNFLIY